MPDVLVHADEHRVFGDLVRAKSGIELPEIRRGELDRVIAKTLTETGLSDVHALYVRLASPEGKRELEDFIGALTIGETYFFRNAAQMQALEEHILPERIAARRDVRSLRIWSAGCASGEEPYSIAILLERLLEGSDGWRMLIQGTDVNREALKKARAGSYGPWSFRNVPPHLKRTYFAARGKRLEIVPRIKDRVTFRYLNLVEDAYPSLLTNTYSLDVILCRNVLIYFNDETRRRVIAGFHDALVDGGWLIVGHAEPSQELFSGYESINFPGAVIYRKSGTMSYLPRAVPPPAATAPLLDEWPAWDAEPVMSEESVQVVAEEVVPVPHEDALGLWSAGRHEEALQAFASIAEADPSDVRAAYLAAKLCADRRELESAQMWVGVALTRDPLFAPAHYLRSLILQEEGDLEGALKAVRSSLYADATWPLGHFALGVLFQRVGKARRATKAFDYVLRVLADRPDDEIIDEADGITVGRLRLLAEAHGEVVEGPSARVTSREASE